jgi:hypothetical protein
MQAMEEMKQNSLEAPINEGDIFPPEGVEIHG